MHLITAVQADFPNKITTEAIDKFIADISSKIYKAKGISPSSGWSQIRAREVRIFDFTLPESVEDEVLTDLAPYVGGKLDKISKLYDIPIVGKLIKNKLGLKQVKMDKYKEKAIKENGGNRINKGHPVRIAIIGKLDDGYNEEGVELL